MEGGIWGLVVIVSAFLIQVCAFGISTSIGVYNIEFLDYFDNDTVGVSLISAINWASFLGAGPLASFLMTKVSYRLIALVGSVMVALGIFIMPFVPYIPAFCVLFGVITGIGSCLVYVPSHVLTGLYYERHRSLATGVATSGSGLGGAIMPIVIGKLIEHYGWKGSLIIMAGIQLHLLVFAALLKSPPKAVQKKHGDEQDRLEQGHSVKVGSDLDSTKLLVNQEKNSRAELAAPENTEELFVETGSEAVEMSVNSTVLNGNSTCLAQDSDLSEKTEFIVKSKQNEIAQTDLVERCENENTSDSSDADKDTDKMLHHIYLFTNVGFDVYFLSSILWNSAAATVLAFGPELIVETGISALNSAWLLTIFGLGDFIGGLIGGVIGNIWVKHRIAQYVIANILMGVCIAACPFGSTFGEYAAILMFGGLAFGVVLGLLVVVLTDLIGPKNLSDGLGYIMLSNGIGAFSGPGLTGYIYKVTGSYDLAFYIAAIFAVLAGACMWLIPVIRCLCPKKQSQNQKTLQE